MCAWVCTVYVCMYVYLYVGMCVCECIVCLCVCTVCVYVCVYCMFVCMSCMFAYMYGWKDRWMDLTCTDCNVCNVKQLRHRCNLELTALQRLSQGRWLRWHAFTYKALSSGPSPQSFNRSVSKCNLRSDDQWCSTPPFQTQFRVCHSALRSWNHLQEITKLPCPIPLKSLIRSAQKLKTAPVLHNIDVLSICFLVILFVITVFIHTVFHLQRLRVCGRP